MRGSFASIVKSVGLFGLLAVILVGVGIQLVPYGRAHDNPPVIAEPNWDSPQTRELFFRVCGDCHSNETVWPWYSNIAPMSWLIQRDVDEGRAAFNVSEWGRGENEGEEAVGAFLEGTMPPSMYVALHPSARLSLVEKQAFVEGLTATFGGEGGEGEEGEADGQVGEGEEEGEHEEGEEGEEGSSEHNY